MDAPFIRDEEEEELVQKMIYENARGPEPDGSDDDDFSSQFLNESGEGLESEERDDEVPLTNSGKVHLYIKAVFISRCIDLFVLHLLTNHFSFSLLDHRANLIKSQVLEARRNIYRARTGYPSPHLGILANRWNPERTAVNL